MKVEKSFILQAIVCGDSRNLEINKSSFIGNENRDFVTECSFLQKIYYCQIVKFWQKRNHLVVPS
jgi:hypothetical protein